MTGYDSRLISVFLAILTGTAGFAQQATFTQGMFENTFTQTQDWFAMIMGPDPVQSYALYNTQLQALLPLEKFATLSVAEVGREGPIRLLEIHSMTPYSTPDTVVAVDFTGRTELDRYICGYVVWEGVAENLFQIVRVEKNYLSTETIANMPTVDLVKLMVQFHCSPAAIQTATGATPITGSAAGGGSG